MTLLKSYIKYLISIFILIKYSILSSDFLLLKKVKFNFKSYLRIDKDSNVRVNNLRLINSQLIVSSSDINFKNVTFSNCIVIIDRSTVSIKGNGNIEGYQIKLSETVFNCGDFLSLTKSYAQNAFFTSIKGKITLGKNVNIHATVSIKGGTLNIGNNVFLNHDSELRCEQSVCIGNNVLISTNCIIYDTNTHSTNYEDRRIEISEGYPNNTLQNSEIKYRISKKDVTIGDDVWVGKKAAILKGSFVGDRAIVALGTVVTNTVPKNSIAIGNPFKIKELTQ